MRALTLSVLQLPLARPEPADNIAAVADLVEQAAGEGAQLILPPELFAGDYFCREEDEALFARARPTEQDESVAAMRELAGFKVWNIACEGGTARIGVGVCWDQWYPECARAMALKGAEVLLYPTAIGSEPYDADLDTSRMWRRAMVGHAVSNCMPVAAANRIGHEGPADRSQSFYGHSFITDEWGDYLAEYGRDESGVLTARLDLDRAATHRAGMGFFRDRRPQLYGRLCEDI